MLQTKPQARRGLRRRRRNATQGKWCPLRWEQVEIEEFFIARNEGCYKFLVLSPHSSSMLNGQFEKYPWHIQSNFFFFFFWRHSSQRFSTSFQGEGHHVRKERFLLPLVPPPTPLPPADHKRVSLSAWSSWAWRGAGPICWLECQHFGCRLHICQKFHQYPQKPLAINAASLEKLVD